MYLSWIMLFRYYFHYFRMQPTRKNVCSGTCSMRGKVMRLALGWLSWNNVWFMLTSFFSVWCEHLSKWSQAAKEFQLAKLWSPLFKFFTWSSPRGKNKVLRNSDHMQVINPLTPKISLVILLNVCHTVLVVLFCRILYCINSKSPHW